MPLEPPAVAVSAGTVAGACIAAVFGGAGSGLLCTPVDLLATEPVTSLLPPDDAERLEPNGSLTLKRDDSELQLTAATAITAKMAKRGHEGERKCSTALRIGSPLVRNNTTGELNTERVKTLLTRQH